MSLDILSDLTDGARIYLVPVGPVFGEKDACSFAGTGQYYSGFRIYAREGKTLQADFTISHSALLHGIDNLPTSIKNQIDNQYARLERPRATIVLPNTDKQLVFSRTLVMGVLNVTPDSFSDGGRFFDKATAINQARAMVAAGADIIDIGGESTRPGAAPVWEGDEAERVLPVIEALQDADIPISIDTRHSFVMKKALSAGAHIINDVTALSYDGDSLGIAAASEAPVILMHSKGTPKTMQENPVYDHVLLDVYDYLAERLEECAAAGIARNRIILDPGIGFGKSLIKDNLDLINGLPLFHTLGCPVMVGASRKSFIGAIAGEKSAEGRLPGSVAVAVKAAEAGAQLVRVHDVAETKQALAIIQAFKDTAIIDATH